MSNTGQQAFPEPEPRTTTTLARLISYAKMWPDHDIPICVLVDGIEVPLNYRYCTSAGVVFDAPGGLPLHPPIEDITVPVGAGHPETSRAAARKVRLTYGSHLREVYDLIAVAREGLTADEVDQATGWGHSSSSSAVSSLKRAGWISSIIDLTTGKTRKRKTRTGNSAEVMVIARGLVEST
jgi:hypothetical protein